MRHFIPLFYIFFTMTAFWGCKANKATETSTIQQTVIVPEDFQLIFSRGGCRGRCPVYTIYVNAKGEVKYLGEVFVELEGKHEKMIPQEKVQALIGAFQEANFFEMQERYDDPQIMDLPTMTIECTMNGTSRKVVDRFEAPEALKKLEGQIDTIVGKEGYQAVTD